MKNFFATLFFVFITQQAFANDIIHVIAVNGLAERSIDPNMAILQIEVWGKGSTAKSAQEIQSKLYEKVKEAVSKFKIAKEDFQTENFSINPDFVYDSKTRSNRIAGYRASHNIKLTYRKVDNAGSLVDALSTSNNVDSGGINIQSVSWDSDKKGTVEAAVISEAVKSARATAEELAKAANVKIKMVHRIQHQSSYPQAARAQSFAMSKMISSDAAPTELSTGQIKVHVDVQMEFEIQ